MDAVEATPDVVSEITSDEAECRACLEKIEAGTTYLNLFEAWAPPWDGMENTIAEDLAKLAHIELSTSDKHSKVICELCCTKLQEACRFALLVQVSDKTLRLRYPQIEDESMVTVWPKPIQLDKSINGSVFENGRHIEIKEEVLSDDDYGESQENFREPVCVEIKIEPEEMLEPPPMQITVNGTCSLKDLEVSELENGHEMEEEYLDTPLKEEDRSSCDSDFTPSDLPLECLLCTKVFHSVTGLKAHVIAQHSYKTVKRKVPGKQSPVKKKDKYTCATCRRSFITSTDLMVHETCHNKATCYGCNQKFDTFELLTKHRVHCKAITVKEAPKPKTLEEVKRVIADQPNEDDELPKDHLQCQLCSEKFSDTYYMKIHQEIHHNTNEQVEEMPEPSGTAMETETLESIFSADK